MENLLECLLVKTPTRAKLQFISNDTRKVSMHLNANLSSGIYKVVVMQDSQTLYTEKLNVLE